MEHHASVRFRDNMLQLIDIMLDDIEDDEYCTYLKQFYILILGLDPKELITRFINSTFKLWVDLYSKDMNFFIKNAGVVFSLDVVKNEDKYKRHAEKITIMIQKLQSNDDTFWPMLKKYIQAFIKISLTYILETNMELEHFNPIMFMKNFNISLKIIET